MSEALRDGKTVNAVPAQPPIPELHIQPTQEVVQQEVSARTMNGVYFLLLVDLVLFVWSCLIMACVTEFGVDFTNGNSYKYRFIPVTAAFLVPAVCGTIIHKWLWERERFFYLHASMEATAIVGPFVALFIFSLHVLPTKGLHVIRVGNDIDIYKGAFRVNPLVHRVVTFTGFTMSHQIECPGIHEGERSYWIVGVQTDYVGSYDETGHLFWKYWTANKLREAAKRVIRNALDTAIAGATCDKLKQRDSKYDMAYPDANNALRDLGYKVPYGISLKLHIKKKHQPKQVDEAVTQ